MNESTDLLYVNGVSGGYGRVEVLHDVNVRVASGEFVVLLGSNGAGKTTLLKMISGILKPSEGNIKFGNNDIKNQRPDELVALGMRHVAEGRRILRRLSVVDNLRMGMYSQKCSKLEEAERLREMCDMFPVLGAKRTSVAGTLSGGEQQMLAVAQALISRPELLLLDEPSLGLAPKITKELFENLIRINRENGQTILLVEQMVEEALNMADRGYVMQVGKIVLQGKPEVLRADGAIENAYLGGLAGSGEC